MLQQTTLFGLLSAYICLAYQLRLLRKTCLTCVVINRKVFFSTTIRSLWNLHYNVSMLKNFAT